MIHLGGNRLVDSQGPQFEKGAVGGNPIGLREGQTSLRKKVPWKIYTTKKNPPVEGMLNREEIRNRSPAGNILLLRKNLKGKRRQRGGLIRTWEKRESPRRETSTMRKKKRRTKKRKKTRSREIRRVLSQSPVECMGKRG